MLTINVIANCDLKWHYRVVVVHGCGQEPMTRIFLSISFSSPFTADWWVKGIRYVNWCDGCIIFFVLMLYSIAGVCPAFPPSVSLSLSTSFCKWCCLDPLNYQPMLTCRCCAIWTTHRSGKILLGIFPIMQLFALVEGFNRLMPFLQHGHMVCLCFVPFCLDHVIHLSNLMHHCVWPLPFCQLIIGGCLVATPESCLWLELHFSGCSVIPLLSLLRSFLVFFFTNSCMAFISWVQQMCDITLSLLFSWASHCFFRTSSGLLDFVLVRQLLFGRLSISRHLVGVAMPLSCNNLYFL